MLSNTCDDMVLALAAAHVDPRTNNHVVYSASWIADRPSMIGERNEDWVRRELAWFARGSNKLEDMEAPVPQAFLQCANDRGEVNSAYGHTLFNEDAIPQHRGMAKTLADRLVDTFLREGKSTRHGTAIISERDIHHLAYAHGMNDFICTNALNVMIGSDDRLHIIAQMRSMDAVWGYRADYSMWAYLQGWLLGSLSLEYPELTAGHITFQVANLHVYPRHHELLQQEAEQVHKRLNREAMNASDIMRADYAAKGGQW